LRSTDNLTLVERLLRSYQVLAWLVGTLIIVLFIGVGLKYLLTDGTSAQRLGDSITTFVGIGHGWLYMVYLVVVAVLSRKAKWSTEFTVTTLVVGLVPLATFWVERRATRQVRAQLSA
jgi:integral membrane protein